MPSSSINLSVKRFQQRGQPVISVDTKKKELVGAFKNGGREWQPKGEPEEVKVHDFLEPDLGKAIPYGVYDLSENQGWVSVGIDHDTARFAAEAIRRWWKKMGSKRYSDARAERIGIDGLLEVVIDKSERGRDTAVVVSSTRDGDQNEFVAEAMPQQRCQLRAIHTRHADIQQHAMRLMSLDHSDGFNAV
jgi:hypothetical protein